MPHLEAWDIEIPADRSGGGKLDHEGITRNFLSSIRDNTPLIAPGEDGIKGLEIGNAMLMSAIKERTVTLPIDADAYDAMILELAKQYAGRKTLGATRAPETVESFQKA
jgi:hypothetical protein